MMKNSIRTSVDTVCIGDSILVNDMWEQIIKIANGDFKSENVSDHDTIIVTESHTVAIFAGAMVDVR